MIVLPRPNLKIVNINVLHAFSERRVEILQMVVKCCNKHEWGAGSAKQDSIEGIHLECTFRVLRFG